MTALAALAGRTVTVAGGGISGSAATQALRGLGAHPVVVDARGGAGIAIDDGQLPEGTSLVVTSPGWRPDAPLLLAAAQAGIEVWGEIELAWRLHPVHQVWLGVTGTNGKTTTTEMLACILTAAGLRSLAAGNIGEPLTQAVTATPAYDVLAVELSSFQLHWSRTVAPLAAAVVNVAADHLDWHGDYAAYIADKAKIFAPGTIPVFDADDDGARLLVGGRDRAVGVTRGEPLDGMLGIVEGALTDRAFGGGNLLAVRDLPLQEPHNITNALVAAALARAFDVDAASVARGLASYTAGPHRMQLVGAVDGVRYIDDSKGTNPHATAAALQAHPRAIWIAGGLGKGASFDDLVRGHAQELRGAVLIGACAGQIAKALARHAADVPVFHAPDLDNAVRQASGLARPGDVVLMSPAAASMDMFVDYRQRGQVFAAAVHALESAAVPGASGTGRPGPDSVATSLESS